MTDTLWKEDAARLAAILADGRGAMLWERSSDGRWYLAGTIRSLFDEDILELRWGGAGKPPSKDHSSALEACRYQGIGERDLPTSSQAWICAKSAPPWE